MQSKYFITRLLSKWNSFSLNEIFFTLNFGNRNREKSNAIVRLFWGNECCKFRTSELKITERTQRALEEILSTIGYWNNPFGKLPVYKSSVFFFGREKKKSPVKYFGILGVKEESAREKNWKSPQEVPVKIDFCPWKFSKITPVKTEIVHVKKIKNSAR